MPFPETDPGVLVTSWPRTSDAFEAILAALGHLPDFAAVVLGEPTDVPTPAVFVIPDHWSETDDTHDGGRLRTVAYRLTIRVRGLDCVERLRRLDLLVDLAIASLEGSTLGGICLPSRSRLSAHTYDPGTDDEGAVTLRGEFTYRRLAMPPLR